MAAGHLRVVAGAKHYGGTSDHWAFRDVDLDVAPGELFCLLGPSGSGKSTLLRVLAGLDQLTSGRFDLGGDEGEAPRCGLVFQEPMLLPWLNVHDNIGLGLRYRRNRAQRRDGIIEEVAGQLGIAALLGRRADEISGGQASRVALARTIVTRPQILLLDEPFAALDAGTRHAMQEWLLEVVASLGVTTVFVTHDVDEALHLGGRIGVLAGGGGGLDQIWDVPALSRGEARVSSLRDELIDHVTGAAADPTPLPLEVAVG